MRIAQGWQVHVGEMGVAMSVSWVALVVSVALMGNHTAAAVTRYRLDWPVLHCACLIARTIGARQRNAGSVSWRMNDDRTLSSH
jgi:hypothetical protein